MRQRFKKVAEAVYFGPKPEPVAPLPATIPVSGNQVHRSVYGSRGNEKAIRDDERLFQTSQFLTIQALHKHAGDFNAS